jgi:hypothetical protein
MGKSFKDFEYKCEDGERVSTIQREKGRGDRVGKLKLKCSAMSPAPSDVECEYSDRPFACDGGAEPCEVGAWLAGIKAYSMDSKTQALLYHPYCCKSDEVEINEDKCTEIALNKRIRQKFRRRVGENEVFTSFKCTMEFHERREIVWDLLNEANICPFEISEGSNSEWKELGSKLMKKGKQKLRGKILKRKISSLKKCQSLCEKANDKKAKSCGTVNYNKKAKKCYMYKTKPVSSKCAKPKKKKGWVLMYLEPEPEKNKCY